MRLFVALVPPEGLRRDLERRGEELRGLCRRGRVVPWENIHLTLAFLGETDRRDAVERAMGRAAGAPFSLHTARPGWFPGKKGALCRLARGLTEAGVWMDDRKPFRPHLTLGRDLCPMDGAGLEGWAAACPVGVWRVREMTLMESRRDAGGLRYIPLSRHPLKK